MYLINWNPEKTLLEASLGGRITAGEAEVFLDELRERFEERTHDEFELLLDYERVNRLDDGVREHLESAREIGMLAGAAHVSVRSNEPGANETHEVGEIAELFTEDRRAVGF